jgi:hypothetical protein
LSLAQPLRRAGKEKAGQGIAEQGRAKRCEKKMLHVSASRVRVFSLAIAIGKIPVMKLLFPLVTDKSHSMDGG